MTSLPFNIRHGEFLDVSGTPLRYDDVTLVPARVKLNGNSFSPVFPFSDWCELANHPIPEIVHREENAPWVLGRLIALFNSENTPEDERGEKTCLSAGFLAVLSTAEIAIPFECSDSYGRTSLFFSSEDPPTDEIQTQIANAFYKLLLDEPENLVDYENRMYHSLSGQWFAFGVSLGQPFMDAE